MPIVSHKVLREFVYDIYKGAGGTDEDARIVSDHIVDSNLAGHDSHGVINAPNYIGGMSRRPLMPKKWKSSEKAEQQQSLTSTAHWVWLQHEKLWRWQSKKPKACTIGAVGLHRCGHAGRMGEYPPIAAHAGMIGIVLLNGGGRFMHPHGGTSRRLTAKPGRNFRSPRKWRTTYYWI